MGEVIRFPKSRRKRGPPRRGSERNTIKYHTADQIRFLRRMVRNHAELAESKGNVTGPVQWMVIDILTSSGLRAAEVADLRCGDCLIGHRKSALYVRAEKWGKSRTVQIPQALKLHLRQYLNWKAERGEPCSPNDHLFQGQRGPWTAQAVSQIVKKWLRICRLYESGKSAHSLRHSYAVEHYRKNGCLRGLKKQLGHSSTQVTEIYADVLDEDLQDQVKNLWGK